MGSIEDKDGFGDHELMLTLARKHGLKVVWNRCMMKEHMRLQVG
jgi:predicted CoA-binding protein